jgi:hypothetical protein
VNRTVHRFAKVARSRIHAFKQAGCTHHEGGGYEPQDTDANQEIALIHLNEERKSHPKGGLRLVAIEKMEARWVDAWRRANGFWIIEWK